MFRLVLCRLPVSLVVSTPEALALQAHDFGSPVQRTRMALVGVLHGRWHQKHLCALHVLAGGRVPRVLSSAVAPQLRARCMPAVFCLCPAGTDQSMQLYMSVTPTLKVAPLDVEFFLDLDAMEMEDQEGPLKKLRGWLSQCASGSAAAQDRNLRGSELHLSFYKAAGACAQQLAGDLLATQSPWPLRSPDAINSFGFPALTRVCTLNQEAKIL